MKKLLLLLIATLAAGSVMADSLESLSMLPVQEGGRKKPYLVFAEESVRAMTGRAAWNDGERKWPAIELVTRIWCEPDAGWQKKRLILVNHLPLKQELGLEGERKLFSYEELAGNARLLEMLQEITAWREANPRGRLQGLLKEAADVGMRIAVFEGLLNGGLYRVVPAELGESRTWQTLPEFAHAHPEEAKEALDAFAGLQKALSQPEGDPAPAAEAFVAALEKIKPDLQPDKGRILLEVQYQKLHPFRWAWIMMAAGMIVLGLTAHKAQRGGYVTAWVLIAGAFILQVWGFYARCVVAGRPPVTNMYESVLWVAFGAVLFAMIFEAIYRCRTFFLGALPVAVVALILADTQPLILDRSIQPLVPVLRDNFWLTTHVLTITLSYAAFALALGVGHIALGQVIFGKRPSAALYQYIYRTLQVGVLLLAIGTILGGVWANYSWGRFWDWDPKETWALVALLCYLFVLHGKVFGTWSGFGLAVGAVLGFLSVLMTWYGVNFVLGAGLHSYGFGAGGFGYVSIFVALDVLFVAVAIWRHRVMKSAAAATKKPAQVEA